MALRRLPEKSSDAEIRHDAGFTAQRLKDREAESQTGAPPGQRSDERTSQRDG